MTCTGPHWYAYYRHVGSSSPTCVRYGCEAPNPHYDPDRDPRREHRAEPSRNNPQNAKPVYTGGTRPGERPGPTPQERRP